MSSEFCLQNLIFLKITTSFVQHLFDFVVRATLPQGDQSSALDVKDSFQMTWHLIVFERDYICVSYDTPLYFLAKLYMFLVFQATIVSGKWLLSSVASPKHCLKRLAFYSVQITFTCCTQTVKSGCNLALVQFILNKVFISC